jgi:hypothetical protein
VPAFDTPTSRTRDERATSLTSAQDEVVGQGAAERAVGQARSGAGKSDNPSASLAWDGPRCTKVDAEAVEPQAHCLQQLLFLCKPRHPLPIHNASTPAAALCPTGLGLRYAHPMQQLSHRSITTRVQCNQFLSHMSAGESHRAALYTGQAATLGRPI